MKIHAAIYRSEIDAPFIGASVVSASHWAEQVWVFGRKKEATRSALGEHYANFDVGSDQKLLGAGWHYLGEFVDEGDWIVMLAGDEVLFSYDNVKKAAKWPDLEWMAFQKYQMWNEENYIKAGHAPVVLRAKRYSTAPLRFPDVDIAQSDFSPTALVTPFVPIGEILQFRYMSQKNREMLGVHDPQLEEWKRGGIRVARQN